MPNYKRDNTLTYQNANKRGYKWINDIYPDCIDEDIEQFIDQYGYKLGQAIMVVPFV
jgi:hypothetical protein